MTDAEKYENDKLLLERQIEEYESMITTQYNYMKESALMRIDYHNSYEAYTRLYVATDYQIMPGMTYQNKDYTSAVLSYYVSILNDYNVMETIAQEVNMEVEYLQELVDVWTSADCYLDIRVWHSSNTIATKIMDLLLDVVEEYEKTASKVIADHSIDILLESSYKYTGDYIGQRQREEEARLTSLKTELKATTEELANLEAPGSGALKYAVLGGIGGAAVYVFYLLVVYLGSGKLRTGDDLSHRFGMKLLGKRAVEGQKLDAVARFLRKLEGKTLENSPENDALIAERISTCCQDHPTVLVTCTADAVLAEKTVETLQEYITQPKLVYCGSILKNAAAAHQLREQSGILLIEVSGQSRTKDIAAELELIKDAGCTVVGCVLAE